MAEGHVRPTAVSVRRGKIGFRNIIYKMKNRVSMRAYFFDNGNSIGRAYSCAGGFVLPLRFVDAGRFSPE